MKLNPDCIRAILLSVEESTDCDSIFHYCRDENKHPQLAKYDHNEIYYHMRQCDMSGFFAGYTPCDGGDLVIIRDLTPAGHEFLANIRQESIWSNTKEIAGKIGSNSLSTLAQIAVNVASSMVNKHFGLN